MQNVEPTRVNLDDLRNLIRTRGVEILLDGTKLSASPIVAWRADGRVIVVDDGEDECFTRGTWFMLNCRDELAYSGNKMEDEGAPLVVPEAWLEGLECTQFAPEVDDGVAERALRIKRLLRIGQAAAALRLAGEKEEQLDDSAARDCLAAAQAALSDAVSLLPQSVLSEEEAAAEAIRRG